MVSLFMTGASGFVGRHFLARYAGKFDEIILPLRKDPGEDYPANVTVKRVRGTPDEIANLLLMSPCNIVLNCAAYGVSPGARDPSDMAALNVELPVLLAKSAQKIGAQKFVQLGSMSEYIPPTTSRPTTETDLLLGDVAGYGGSKAEASRQLKALSASGETQISCLRLFGIYGPGEGPHRLLVSLYNTLSSDAVAPMSPGTQIRDFIYIYDVIDAMYCAIEKPLPTKFTALNIGSGDGVSVARFAKTFCRVAGFSIDKLNLGALPLRDTDVAYMVANIRAAKSVLNWEPKWSQESALKNYSDYLSSSF